MFVKVKSTMGVISMININHIEAVGQNERFIVITTKSTRIEVEGTLELFAKTLSDIMRTKQIMWYKPQETK